MGDKFKLRSIPDNENYATYLALPLLGLSKYNFGEGNFMNSYLTINGNIAVLVRSIDATGWNFWEHRFYNTDLPYFDGILIVFNTPPGFHQDVIHLLDGKYSQLSEKAMELVTEYSGLHVNFKMKDGTTFSSRLISIIHKDPKYRHKLEERLGTRLRDDEELEPKLREQDVLYDVDTSVEFELLIGKEDTDGPERDNKD